MESEFEVILTTSHKREMIAYIYSHPECFEEGIKLAVSDKQPYSWRAAWCLWSCMEKNDNRIRKHIKEIIKILPNRKYNQQRELLKIIELMEIDDKYIGTLFKYCVSIWLNVNSKPSVRYNAFRILAKIALKHVELNRELELLTKERYTESLSPGVYNAIGKLMSKIK